MFTQHFGQSVLSFCCAQGCVKCSLQAARCPTESLRGEEGNVKRGNEMEKLSSAPSTASLPLP